LKRMLASDFGVETACGMEKRDLGVLVCGCPATCADRPERRSQVREWILVVGPAVEKELIPENEMETIVAMKINKYFERRNSDEVA